MSSEKVVGLLSQQPVVSERKEARYSKSCQIRLKDAAKNMKFTILSFRMGLSLLRYSP